jgi:hypothetical protein
MSDVLKLALNPVSAAALAVFVVSGGAFVYHLVGMFNNRTAYVHSTFQFDISWNSDHKTTGLTERGVYHRVWAQRMVNVGGVAGLIWFAAIVWTALR